MDGGWIPFFDQLVIASGWYVFSFICTAFVLKMDVWGSFWITFIKNGVSGRACDNAINLLEKERKEFRVGRGGAVGGGGMV